MGVPYIVDRIENANGGHILTSITSDAVLVMTFPGEGLHLCFYLDLQPEHVVYFNGAWPDTVNAAAIGRRGCELIDHPIFAPGTIAGEAIIVGCCNMDSLVNHYAYDDAWLNTQAISFDRLVVPFDQS